MNLQLLLFLMGLGAILILIGLGGVGFSISAFDEIYAGLPFNDRIIGFVMPFGIGCGFIISGIVLMIKSYNKLKALTNN